MCLLQSRLSSYCRLPTTRNGRSLINRVTAMTSEPRSVMTTINSERFAEICSKVWLDRSAVLTGRGLLSGEGALVRAVYWRLRNLAALPANSTENYGSPQTVSAYRMGVG